MDDSAPRHSPAGPRAEWSDPLRLVHELRDRFDPISRARRGFPPGLDPPAKRSEVGREIRHGEESRRGRTRGQVRQQPRRRGGEPCPGTLLLVGPHADDEKIGRASRGHVEKPRLFGFVELLLGLLPGAPSDGPRDLVAVLRTPDPEPGLWRLGLAPDAPVDRSVPLAAGIRQKDDRRLEPLRAVERQEPHGAHRSGARAHLLRVALFGQAAQVSDDRRERLAVRRESAGDRDRFQQVAGARSAELARTAVRDGAEPARDPGQCGRRRITLRDLVRLAQRLHRSENARIGRRRRRSESVKATPFALVAIQGVVVHSEKGTSQ